MRFEARKREILTQLKSKGEIEVVELASLLAVSDITIRRDLDRLAKERLLIRTHGGAIPVETKPLISFDQKSTQNLKAKSIIAQKAAQKIKEGDIIFLDCGSTTFQMCKYIKHLDIKVITNSLPVASELQNTQIRVNLIGGEIDSKRQAIHGKMAEWHINQYHADKAFIGVDAIDNKGGLWAQSEKEAGNSLAMLESSDITYVLADTSKLGKKSNLKFSEVKNEVELITEK